MTTITLISGLFSWRVSTKMAGQYNLRLEVTVAEWAGDVMGRGRGARSVFSSLAFLLLGLGSPCFDVSSPGLTMESQAERSCASFSHEEGVMPQDFMVTFSESLCLFF